MNSMEGREESRAQMTDTDPWKFPRRNRDHNSKWVGQGRTPRQSLFRSPGARGKPNHPPLPVWLQGDLLLYNREFHWSLSLVPRRDNLNPWDFPSNMSVFVNSESLGSHLSLY